MADGELITGKELDYLLQEKEARAMRLAERGIRMRNQPITRARREMVLRLVAAGVSKSRACELAEVDPAAFSKEVKRNPELAEQLEEAFDASVERVEERLEEIALHGDPNKMPTVRAGEAVLQKSRRYRKGGQSKASAEVTQQGVKVSIGTPGPD